MKKKNDPSSNESPVPPLTLHPFSNNRRLDENEWFVLRLACLTNYKDCEPISITRTRSRIETAEKVLSHLALDSLPPIFDSFEYEGLRLKGVA